MSLEPETLGGVARWILRHPCQAIARRWNYKAALLSAVLRATLFFGTNLSAGLPAATSAMTTEFLFRFAGSGFFGALTQAFRRVQPERAAMLTVIVLLSAISHSLELLVHWVRGTPELLVSILASITFTAVSTAFNLFAMRRGALVVGVGQPSLLADLRLMPKLVVLFVASSARTCMRRTREDARASTHGTTHRRGYRAISAFLQSARTGCAELVRAACQHRASAKASAGRPRHDRGGLFGSDVSHHRYAKSMDW